MGNIKVASIISDFSKNINWKNLPQVNILEKRNKKIIKFKREIERFNEKEEYEKLSLKLINFLKEVLVTANKNYSKQKELFDELYWFRYSFVDKEEDSLLLDEISNIFFEFQSDPNYDELIKKIDFARKKISLIISKT